MAVRPAPPRTNRRQEQCARDDGKEPCQRWPAREPECRSLERKLGHCNAQRTAVGIDDGGDSERKPVYIAGRGRQPDELSVVPECTILERAGSEHGVCACDGELRIRCGSDHLQCHDAPAGARRGDLDGRLCITPAVDDLAVRRRFDPIKANKCTGVGGTYQRRPRIQPERQHRDQQIQRHPPPNGLDDARVPWCCQEWCCVHGVLQQ